ncbi:MAG: LexA family transcriptional regulator [Saprospiraceae bacterium]|nr:LexA family transcriptional regulator [Saprospiraceae bacterium]
MLSENIRYLRKKDNLSQQQLAEKLSIPRTTLGDYERGHTEPSMDTLIHIAGIFDISIDALLKERLAHLDLEVLRTDNFRVLAISVNDQNRQNIEFVSTKARAGYLESFQDPDYIKELPKMYFPSIPEGSYRAFEIQGDSMVPLDSGSIVVCSYVEQLEELKNDRTYVIATHLDGIVYKRVLINPDKTSLTAISDNPTYPPYKIRYQDIAEVWSYYAHISFTDTKKAVEHAIDERISDIQENVQFIKEQMS